MTPAHFQTEKHKEMDSVLLSSLTSLNAQQKSSLEKGGYKNLSDLLLSNPSDISRTTRIAPLEVTRILEVAYRERAAPINKIKDLPMEGEEKFTTGDAELDSMLGGGIRTGMLWEVVGESAAGKTQLALQLSLLVQLPPSLGGVLGSAFYLTVASQLQTTRMEQILNNHPLLSPPLCSFANIQHASVPTIEKLIFVLSKSLPQYISANDQNSPSSRPLKLIVIDAIAELFHTSKRTTTQFLVERSRRLSEIGMLLHSLASKHQIAVLVLNEVSDTIDRDTAPLDSGQIGYKDQFRWFGRAGSILGEDRKEATLGLVWSNQLNVRIFLSRTGRRRYLEESERPTKLQRSISVTSSNDSAGNQQPVLIRRLTVVFSSVCDPASCDYVVTAEGISVIPGSAVLLTVRHGVSTAALLGSVHDSVPPRGDLTRMPNAQLASLDIGHVVDSTAVDSRQSTPDNEPGDDEWDAFWERNELPECVFEEVANLTESS
ncbi:P-loop containing nucleoside triphosphate hydrolase protein [Suillus bovinus]|uniref:P-loop containing nucleoside triphosphate hydrolase protein n=1 Tax=Suillus bovinus TaxID=48563 RepID=UPI001B85B3BF|nr:P-loop containing nucleoside triphosphate hydrolase protein [Suillus bovinus]KAG2146951.1 P-loop containing nucleoside triphosphate hydrolase protein [Suillus bovinus]